MSGPLDSITGDLVSKALDVSLQVHKTIAHNIANAETSGYRPMKVNFDDVMAQVRSAFDSDLSNTAIRSALDNVSAVPEQESLDTTVLLDQQMVQLVQNTTHYQALLAARNSFGDIMKLAIKGGRS